MQCSSPVFLKDVGLEVPCGRCINCRISRSREWAVRLMCEMKYHENALFTTFTYDEEHCPTDYGLHKKELQLFNKRLRFHLDKQGRKIKFFACGEYGEQYGRPHYHGIYFDIGFADKPLLEQCWDKGNIYLGLVEYDSCRYVTDYVLKKWSGKKADDEYQGREPPFQLFSRGLGKQYVLDNYERLKRTLSVRQQGVSKGLPRYFKNKLSDIADEQAWSILMNGDGRDIDEIFESTHAYSLPLHDRARQQKVDEFKSWISQVEAGNFGGSFDEWHNLRNRQRLLTAEAKTNVYSRKIGKGDL